MICGVYKGDHLLWGGAKTPSACDWGVLEANITRDFWMLLTKLITCNN